MRTSEYVRHIKIVVRKAWTIAGVFRGTECVKGTMCPFNIKRFR